MTEHAPQPASQIRQWKVYPRADIEAAIDAARAAHPDVIYLTIILKLRTTHEKRYVLDVTQKRVTNMKAEVTRRFFDDLAHINSRETERRFIREVIGFVTDMHPKTDGVAQAVAELERALHRLREQAGGTRFVQAIIAATVPPEEYTHQHANAGWALLERALRRWYEEHPSDRIENTFQAIATAKNDTMLETDQGQVTITEPRYTFEEYKRMQVAILLSRALEARYAASVQARCITALAVLALHTTHDAEQYNRIIKAIHRRSNDRGNRPLIHAIEAAIAYHFGTSVQTGYEMGLLHHWLLRLEADVLRETKRARSKKIPLESAQGVVPLVLRVLTALGATAPAPEDYGNEILLIKLMQWYDRLTTDGDKRPDIFTTEEMRILPAKGNAIWAQHTHTDRMRSAAILLRRFLETAHQCTSDVVLLASMAEDATHGRNDSGQNLGGILSRCYNQVCSLYKYPLSGNLRQAIFADRGENIIGWCQLVIDYKRERNNAIPGNQPPKQKEHEPKNFELLKIFVRTSRQRITHCDVIYFMWLHEHEGYQAAVAKEVPVGYDAGKTLGNPYPSRRRKRRGARKIGRRRTILGHGSVGKKGARRMKKWLLPPHKRDEAIEDLTVLIYPRSYSKERREQARQKPHPYWVKRQKRGVSAVRPSQYRAKRSNRPVRYREMSHRQRVQFREQLREQARHVEEFSEFEQALDRFLESAPPAPPHIEPMLLTEQEIAALPPEAQLDPPTSFEAHRAAYEQRLGWFADFLPSGSSHHNEHTDEKLFDVETMAARELEVSAAELLQGRGQPIRFTRTMDVRLSNKTCGLFYYVRERHGYQDYRYILACELVGDTADERSRLIQKDTERTAKDVENYFVNWPTVRFNRPANTSIQFFGVEMGGKHQARILREFIDWRLREPKNKETIAKVDILSEHGKSGRVEWFAHGAVPVQTPSCNRPVKEIIGFHEYEGQYYFAVIDLDSRVVEFGEIMLPETIKPKTDDGMTNDNFAFETATCMVRQSIRREEGAGDNEDDGRWGAFIGIEDTDWKREQVDTDPVQNRQNVSTPRERIIHIATYKAAMERLPPPRVVKGVAPSRDCGQCGYRIEGNTGIKERTVTRCFVCEASNRAYELKDCTDEAGTVYKHCSTCDRVWQEQEPQYRCRQCGYQQHARYNAALVTAKRTLQKLVEGNEKDEEEDTVEDEGSREDPENLEVEDEEDTEEPL